MLCVHTLCAEGRYRHTVQLMLLAGMVSKRRHAPRVEVWLASGARANGGLIGLIA